MLDPFFVTLDFNRPILGPDADPFISLPDEKVEHPEGIFWGQDVKAFVEDKPYLTVACGSSSKIRVLSDHLKLYTQTECQQRGLSYLKGHFSGFFQNAKALALTIKEPDRGGVWGFKWSQLGQDGLPDVTASVSVRAIDGKVTSFGLHKLSERAVHPVTPAQARQKAVEFASQNVNVTNVKVVNILEMNNNLPSYLIDLEAKDRESGAPLKGDVYINAITGNVIKGTTIPNIAWELSEQDWRDPKVVVEDTSPVWTKQGLLFNSYRTLAGMPMWAVFPAQLCLRNDRGQLFHLTSDMESGFQSFTGTAYSPWAVIGRNFWIYSVNLTTGDYKILQNPLQSIQEESRSDEGITSPFEIVSPDGHWLYFEVKKLGQHASLNRIRRDLIKPGKALKANGQRDALGSLPHFKIKNSQIILAELPDNIHRLSLFPDGEHLLMHSDKGMYIINIADHRFTPLSLPGLKDAELAGVPLQEIKDAWVGPSNDEVTFSGKTTDNGGKVRWRIYSCHLDGSGLQALTPTDNAPVEAYQFASGKTATDLAKDWALSEIRYTDDLNRKIR
ncbi:MAG: PepSY domain-containing protein [Abitibacteriaceae bacterium]|nr:PepSY domain-containing protein [Abditibacteriaceae bacterium]